MPAYQPFDKIRKGTVIFIRCYMLFLQTMDLLCS
jgi:hypothetical protein